jgi:hypothetical protein
MWIAEVRSNGRGAVEFVDGSQVVRGQADDSRQPVISVAVVVLMGPRPNVPVR